MFLYFKDSLVNLDNVTIGKCEKPTPLGVGWIA